MFFKSFKFEKAYITLILISSIAPSFGAIDNNAIRWFFISTITIIYLCKNFKNSHLLSIGNKSIIFLGLIIAYLILSIIISENKEEATISSLKIIVLISVFLSSILAFKSLKNPFIYLSRVIVFILLIEVLFTIITYLIPIYGDFTGISMNRNISTFSILLKVPILLYYFSKLEINSFFRPYIILFEILTIFSIFILESRAGIVLIFLIYFSLFFYKAYSKRRLIFLLLLALISFLGFVSSMSNYLNKKALNPTELLQDESLNYRVDYYINSLKLFKSNPIFGHGIGSWKIESLQFQDYNDSTILSPYYVHNDFLQILMELGLIGLALYLFILFNFLIFLIKRFKKGKYFLILICFVIFLIDSSLNFPIHRSQEIIPFVLIISYLSFESLKKKPEIVESRKIKLLLVFLCSVSSVSLFLEHRSLKLQGELYDDYSNNTFNVDYKMLKPLDYSFPNLSANTVPLSTYISRYYINDNDFNKANQLLRKAQLNNPNDLMTKELQLKVSIQFGNYQESLDQLNFLMSRYPNNTLYFQLFNDINDLL
ncbi:MAG: O-antigen ligase family protein, partial [Flavobacteriaceae bacterium]|nr:O-antigen ligase family protein [Flavobacteriaceae bacterium]